MLWFGSEGRGEVKGRTAPENKTDEPLTDIH